MKKITLLLLLFTTVMQAQRFDWVTTASSSIGAIALARDSQGNLYTLEAGNSAQTCQGINVIAFNTGTNMFLYKFDAFGNIVYIKPIGGNFTALNLVIGDNDNVYVLGSLQGTNVIKYGTETFTDTENRNYIFKFNPTGDLIWRAKNNVSFGNFTECSLLLFTNNHIYFQSSGLSISKLDTDGQYTGTLSATSFTSSTSTTAVFFRAAGILTNGDLIFSAISRGTITYGLTVLTPTYNQFLHTPILTLRTNENLGFVWANYTDGLRDPDLNIIPMAIGNDNGIYLGLQISGTVTAGSDTIVSEDTSGNTIGAILKMDANGNKIWVKSTTNNVQTWTIMNNPDGSGVFCGGQIFGFQPVALGTTSVNPSNGNAFISKIDYNGVFQNSFSFASGPIGSYVRSLATNNAGIFYVGGRLNNNSIPVFSCIPRQENSGLFLGKFTEQPDRATTPTISAIGNTLTASPIFAGNIQWLTNGTVIAGATLQTLTATQTGNYTVNYILPDYTACVATSTVFNLAVLAINIFDSNYFSVFPNPSIGIFAIKTNMPLEKILLTVSDLNGRIVHQSIIEVIENQSLDLSHLQNGMYILKISNENFIHSQKIIKD